LFYEYNYIPNGVNIKYYFIFLYIRAKGSISMNKTVELVRLWGEFEQQFPMEHWLNFSNTNAQKPRAEKR